MRTSPRFAWGGVRAADGGGKLFAAMIHDPAVASAAWLQAARRRHLPSFAATAWTHLPEGGYRIANPRLDGPQSETVNRGQFLEQSICREFPQFPQAICQSRGSAPSIPAFSAISAARFDCRRRRVADTAGSPGRRHDATPIRQKRGDRRLRTIDGADMAVILLPGYE
jgi:hypothetical protein